MREHRFNVSRIFVWSLLLAFSVSCAQGVSFYVSPQGDDGWSGRLAQPNASRTDGPLASLAGARDAVRRLKSKGPISEAVHVTIADGVYRLTEPVVFTAEDSGAEKCPVVYEAAAGAMPIFTAGRVISAFKAGEEGIWQTHIPEVAAGKWYF